MFCKPTTIGLVFSIVSCCVSSTALLAQDVSPQAHTGTIIEQPFHPNTGNQPSFQNHPAPLAHTGTINNNSNQQVISQLQNILNQQAQFGHSPGNNVLLQKIRNLINQHGNSFANQPIGNSPPSGSVPPNQGTVVMITNNGPGNLQVMRQNQTTFVLPSGNSQQLPVNTTISFKATQQNTNIAIKHLQGGLAKFWDADDQRYSRIRPNQTQTYELGFNNAGYQLMKYN